MKQINLLAAFILVILPTSPLFAADWLYTVRPGDTLWDLCLRYTNKPGCWRQLDKVNNVTFPRRLPPGFVVSFPVSWLKTVPTPVEVSFISGEVNVQRQPNSPSQAVTVGDKFPIGAKITTGEGNVNLRFADGSTMQLEPHSELTLDTLSTVDGIGIVDSRLRLNQGAVKTRVIKRKPASRFQITTPAAVAAVRGTQYRVSSVSGEKPLMRGEVFAGLVDVSLSETSADKTAQAVAAGFGIVAKQGETLTKPRPLLPSPVFTVNKAPQILPAVISWQQLTGTVSYQLEILKDNNNEELLQRLQLSTLSYTSNILATGCYRLRLRGIDNEQLQGMATQQTLCIAPALAAPTINTNIRYQGRFAATLRWAAIEGAAQYRWQLASDSAFQHIIEERLVNETQLSLTAKGTVFVRVQAMGKEGQTTAFSQTFAWQPQPSHWPALIVYGLIALVLL